MSKCGFATLLIPLGGADDVCRRPGGALKARALQCLAQREHSRAELRRKLMTHALALAPAHAIDENGAGVQAPAERVEALLDWLEAQRHLSQERFVESRVQARSSRFGNLRIRQELKQHELTLSADAARALNDTELQRARSVRERKFDTLPESHAERARQARFLAGRGFSHEAIRAVLREAGRSGDDEPAC